MSSSRNYSISELRALVIERGNNLFELYENRFKPQEARLFQTGILTSEQQDLNQQLTKVHDCFVKVSKAIEASGTLILGFLDLQPFIHHHQQLGDQISATFSPVFYEMETVINDLEGNVQELESIFILVVQK